MKKIIERNNTNDNIFIEKDVGGISVLINNFLDVNLSTSKKHRFTRIFKNDYRIKFSGKVHEQVADSITSAGYGIVESDIVINHYGYIGKNIEKEKRNKTLLEQEATEKNDDDFIKYHIANTDFSMGNYSSALELYTNLLPSKQLSTLQIEQVKIRIAQIYLTQNQLDDVIKILNFTSNDLDNEGLRLSILGAAYLHLKDFHKAKEIYSKNEIIESKLVDKNIIDNARKIFEILKI
jgi:tetratricopeptide (TPR) repeat protein